MGSQRRPAVVRAFDELRRRHVFGSVAAYIILAAFIIELSGPIFEALLLPDWGPRLVTVLLILGLPVIAVLSWFFDISMRGIERTPEKERQIGSSREKLGAALQRSHATPVPDGPVQRRKPAAAGATGRTVGGPTAPGETGETAGLASRPDPVRVREAVLGHLRHELRTPINGIIGYAEMLLEDVDDEALTVDLERIRKAGRQLLERVDAVLLPGHAPPDATDDLKAFGEKVRVDLRTPISAVVGYAEMLQESCEEAGRDDLLDDLGRILRSARRLLELSDDIVRMATRTAERAGVLDEASAVTEQVLARIRPMSESPGTPEGGGRLLVVDDNETNRDLISRQLARFGYTVDTATDGLEALDRLASRDFDLVLLDVIMPRLNGVETLARLRQDDRLADIPVIMLSSLNELDSAVRCIEMGATDYLTKPIQPALLEARIAAALEVRDLRGREHAYRRRVEADGDLIDRLLQGAFPPFVQDRIRGGVLDIRESWEETVVVRVIYPSELRPTGGPTAVDRIEALQAFTRAAEELAVEHGVGGLIWRPDGLLAVTPDADDQAVAVAARFALAVRGRLRECGIGVHRGPLAAGVVGDRSPRFEVWGEAVDAADALAAHAAAGTVLVTPVVQTALGEAFELEAKGVKEVRGRGQMRVWSLAPASRSAVAPSSPGAA